jgi:hypothetical protein
MNSEYFMPDETNPRLLIQNMQPELKEGEYVFASFNKEKIIYKKLNPICTFMEKEGISVIINRDEADLNKIQYEFVFSMITLNIHSSLNAVGFLAKIISELANHNISVNPVSAYYHDHLFVLSSKAEEVFAILNNLKQKV